MEAREGVEIRDVVEFVSTILWKNSSKYEGMMEKLKM